MYLESIADVIERKGLRALVDGWLDAVVGIISYIMLMVKSELLFFYLLSVWILITNTFFF